MLQITDSIKYYFAKRAFGVCNYIGDKIGISSEHIRLYFIYTSFITFGSPILFYLIVAFWLNIKKYIHKKRVSVFDL